MVVPNGEADVHTGNHLNKIVSLSCCDNDTILML